MQKLDWSTPFRDVQSLVCEAIQSGEAEDLFLQVVEHHVSDQEGSLTIGGVTLSGLRPIERTATSRQWRVYWDYVVAFKSSSESFYFSIYCIDGPESGRSFKVAESVWLEELRAEGVLEAVYPTCQHFVICTDHKIIEVLAPREPRIET